MIPIIHDEEDMQYCFLIWCRISAHFQQAYYVAYTVGVLYITAVMFQNNLAVTQPAQK